MLATPLGVDFESESCGIAATTTARWCKRTSDVGVRRMLSGELSRAKPGDGVCTDEPGEPESESPSENFRRATNSSAAAASCALARRKCFSASAFMVSGESGEPGEPPRGRKVVTSGDAGELNDPLEYVASRWVLMAKLSRTFLGECIPKISADSPVSPSHFRHAGDSGLMSVECSRMRSARETPLSCGGSSITTRSSNNDPLRNPPCTKMKGPYDALAWRHRRPTSEAAS